MSLPVDLPHFNAPFTFTKGVAVVNQQGSDGDLTSQVNNVVSCAIGAWPIDPEFGIPDPTFSSSPLNTSVIAKQIERIVPDASVTITEAGGLADPSTRTVTIDVQTRQR